MLDEKSEAFLGSQSPIVRIDWLCTISSARRLMHFTKAIAFFGVSTNGYVVVLSFVQTLP
jgi:hypothetical protein